MLNDFPRKVGANIHTYRKALNLSLDELATRINKSKATISKYESGAIVIDIITLYEISEALQVDMPNLLACVKEEDSELPIVGNGIKLPSMMYLYHTHQLRYYTSLLYLNPTKDNKISATLYYKAMSAPGNYIKCTNIYHGELFSSDTNLNMIFTNFHNKKDMVYLICYLPIHITESYPGLLLGVQNTNMRPAVLRTLLSSKPLNRSYLEKNLQLTKDHYRRLKNGAYYSVEEPIE